jgi:hypothetical protein
LSLEGIHHCQKLKKEVSLSPSLLLPPSPRLSCFFSPRPYWKAASTFSSLLALPPSPRLASLASTESALPSFSALLGSPPFV